MRATLWRQKLIGDKKTVLRLRKKYIPFHERTKYDIQINLDCHRTHFVDKGLLEHVLRCYVNTNKGLGYAQGMNFVAGIILKCYLESEEPDFAVIDTFYSLHTAMIKIRLFYPLSWRDDSPLRVIGASAKLLRMHLEMENHILLGAEFDFFLTTFLLRSWPSLFANMFSTDSVMLMWDYLLTGRLRSRLFSLTLALFNNQKVMLRYLSPAKLFKVIDNEHLHVNVIKEALRHDTQGRFLLL